MKLLYIPHSRYVTFYPTLTNFFQPVPNPDFVIPVEIEGNVHNVYVLKRPFVDEFLARLGPQFEIVIFTASLSKYADPVIDNLDKSKYDSFISILR